jgi:ATP phosphoribosyltransferase
MLTIALPNKGRLSDDARTLFADAGLEVRARGDRALIGSLGDDFHAVFVRAQDIPEFVADGAAHAGVTGLDLVRESGRPLATVMDLEFGSCRMVVAARDDRGIRCVQDIPRDARVATVYPNVARTYFADANLPITIVPVSGASEIAPHLGIADVIVDITSTGSTLKVNGLREIATIFASSAHLVAATLTTAQQTALDDLAATLDSVIQARSRRYLMANVPRTRLDDVKRVLPGLNGPTVVDVLNGGEMVAVHAVVDAASIVRKVADLRAIGGRGILVTRIERLVP